MRPEPAEEALGEVTDHGDWVETILNHLRDVGTVRPEPVVVNDDTVTVAGRCIITKRPHTVTVPRGEWDAWQAGRLIQDAMPSVSVDDREFLMTGISPAGWDTLEDPDE